MLVVLCPAILSSDTASDPGRQDLLRARRRLCGSECCSSNSNAPDTCQKGLIGIQSHHSRGKMARKKKLVKKRKRSVPLVCPPMAPWLAYEQVTSQPSRPDHGSLAGVPYLVYRALENGRNTASLTFNSRLAFSVGIHVTLLAGVSPAKRQRATLRVFQCKKRDAILYASDAFNLECFSCKKTYVMQGCRVRVVPAAPEPEPLGQFVRSRSQSRILKVGRHQLRERLSAAHIKRNEQRQA